MKNAAVACALLALALSPALAGVAIEMEESGAAPGNTAGIDKLFVDGEKLRMEPHSQPGTSIVFRDDTLWIVDHDKKVARKLDREGMERMGEQLGGAMKQMEAEMAKLPPEQREMVMKMMKGRMPAGMAGGGEAEPLRIEAGGTEKVGAYTCTVHTAFAGDRKVWEVCSATGGVPDGLERATAAFTAMSKFVEGLTKTLRQGPLGGMLDSPFYDMDRVGGFPVRVRSFRDGKPVGETTLRSVEPRDFDAGFFGVPEGYDVRDLATEMNPGR